MTDKNDDYSDIIEMPHHVSVRHPQMSMLDRAAQFSPFAALTGYDEAIDKTARIVADDMSFGDDYLTDKYLQGVK